MATIKTNARPKTAYPLLLRTLLIALYPIMRSEPWFWLAVPVSCKDFFNIRNRSLGNSALIVIVTFLILLIHRQLKNERAYGLSSIKLCTNLTIVWWSMALASTTCKAGIAQYMPTVTVFLKFKVLLRAIYKMVYSLTICRKHISLPLS